MPLASDALVRRTVAPAKINWTLEVLGKRAEGYHEIRSVMQTISLADQLELHLTDAYSLAVGGPESRDVPVRDNLVESAVRAFPNELRSRPVALRLTKHIPAAAGLGGGSSDAAAALRLLGRLWKPQQTRITSLAASLGSDVSFFLRGGTQVASGRGESLTPLPTAPTQHLVLITPPIAIADKTARLYARIGPRHYTDGSATRRLAERLKVGLGVQPTDYFNVFDAVANDVFPDLATYRRLLERLTGTRAMLAGAGPSLFSFTDEVTEPSGRWHADDLLMREGVRAWSVATTGPPGHQPDAPDSTIN